MFKNIFNIPNHVLLPEDEVQTAATTQSEEEMLDDEIKALEMKIWAVCKTFFFFFFQYFLSFSILLIKKTNLCFVCPIDKILIYIHNHIVVGLYIY